MKHDYAAGYRAGLEAAARIVDRLESGASERADCLLVQADTLGAAISQSAAYMAAACAAAIRKLPAPTHLRPSPAPPEEPDEEVPQ